MNNTDMPSSLGMPPSSLFPRPPKNRVSKRVNLDMQRQLTIIKGPDSGRSFALADGQILTIGRGRASNTQIQDPRISRVHCKVFLKGDQATLTDAGSMGGTHVRGIAISEVLLVPGDIFRVGDTEIIYQTTAPPAAQQSREDLAFGRPKPKPSVKPLQDLVGDTIAQYQLKRILAVGNNGMVFRAVDLNEDRVVALKALTPEIASEDEQKSRFVREMSKMLPVRHPNIVSVLHAGQQGPYCWFAMEYVDGECLTALVERAGDGEALDWKSVWRVAVQIANALSAAYDAGIVHRNVSPANILRRHSDRVCVLGDLMLAKALEGTLTQQMTQPGQWIGDVPYMAPERTHSIDTADHRSDLYGLGATLMALLTGKPPFVSESLPEVLKSVREETPDLPLDFQGQIEPQFQSVLFRLLAKAPEERFQTANELLAELDTIGKQNGLVCD